MPIIALTADFFAENAKKYRKSGMNSVIVKPINEKMLYNKTE